VRLTQSTNESDEERIIRHSRYTITTSDLPPTVTKEEEDESPPTLQEEVNIPPPHPSKKESVRERLYNFFHRKSPDRKSPVASPGSTDESQPKTPTIGSKGAPDDSASPSTPKHQLGDIMEHAAEDAPGSSAPPSRSPKMSLTPSDADIHSHRAAAAMKADTSSDAPSDTEVPATSSTGAQDGTKGRGFAKLAAKVAYALHWKRGSPSAIKVEDETSISSKQSQDNDPSEQSQDNDPSNVSDTHRSLRTRASVAFKDKLDDRASNVSDSSSINMRSSMSVNETPLVMIESTRESELTAHWGCHLIRVLVADNIDLLVICSGMLLLLLFISLAIGIMVQLCIHVGKPQSGEYIMFVHSFNVL